MGSRGTTGRNCNNGAARRRTHRSGRASDTDASMLSLRSLTRALCSLETCPSHLSRPPIRVLGASAYPSPWRLDRDSVTRSATFSLLLLYTLRGPWCSHCARSESIPARPPSESAIQVGLWCSLCGSHAARVRRLHDPATAGTGASRETCTSL